VLSGAGLEVAPGVSLYEVPIEHRHRTGVVRTCHCLIDASPASHPQPVCGLGGSGITPSWDLAPGMPSTCLIRPIPLLYGSRPRTGSFESCGATSKYVTPHKSLRTLFRTLRIHSVHCDAATRMPVLPASSDLVGGSRKLGGASSATRILAVS
jgi:hypothetical protein